MYIFYLQFKQNLPSLCLIINFYCHKYLKQIVVLHTVIYQTLTSLAWPSSNNKLHDHCIAKKPVSDKDGQTMVWAIFTNKIEISMGLFL